MSFGRLLQRIVLKCVLHMQHDYFSSSINQAIVFLRRRRRRRLPCFSSLSTPSSSPVYIDLHLRLSHHYNRPRLPIIIITIITACSLFITSNTKLWVYSVKSCLVELFIFLFSVLRTLDSKILFLWSLNMSRMVISWVTWGRAEAWMTTTLRTGHKATNKFEFIAVNIDVLANSRRNELLVLKEGRLMSWSSQFPLLKRFPFYKISLKRGTSFSFCINIENSRQCWVSVFQNWIE